MIDVKYLAEADLTRSIDTEASRYAAYRFSEYA
jgi:hypothetical protein